MDVHLRGDVTLPPLSVAARALDSRQRGNSTRHDDDRVPGAAAETVETTVDGRLRARCLSRDRSRPVTSGYRCGERHVPETMVYFLLYLSRALVKSKTTTRTIEDEADVDVERACATDRLYKYCRSKYYDFCVTLCVFELLLKRLTLNSHNVIYLFDNNSVCFCNILLYLTFTCFCLIHN